MGSYFSADIVIVQLILLLHILVLLPLLVNIVVALDGSKKLSLNLELDFGTVVATLLVLFYVQSLLSKVTILSSSSVGNGFLLSLILSTHIEWIVLIVTVSIMLLVCVRQYRHNHHAEVA